MIQLENFGYFLPQGFLFRDINVQINKTDKIGLCGKNGAGKSTLLNLISKKIQPSEGKIHQQKGMSIGYLSQDIVVDSNKNLKEYVFSSNPELNNINSKLDFINNQLTTRVDYESDSYLGLLDELEELNHQFSFIGGNAWEESVELILKGLGFHNEDFYKPLNSFSGGWKMRAELAKILVNEPELLLLDEPTNHLDILSIEWLENYLKKFNSAIVLISHDRLFLDMVTNRTFEISMGKILDYPMSYSKYKIKREEEKEHLNAAKKQQDKDIKNTEQLINKFRAKSSKAAFAQSLIKKLEKTERIEIENDHVSSMKLTFPVNQQPGKWVLELHKVSKKYDQKEILRDINITVGRGDKIALLGPNGVGKSTLFKCIMNKTNFDGEIKLGHNVEPAYFAQDQVLNLNPDETIFEAVDAIAIGDNRKNIRSILGSFLFSGDDIEKKISVLSGGEKTRLCLCLLLFKTSNFLILDEPTNHLDIQSKEVLKIALQNYQGTFIIVSHDREFVEGLTNQIWDISEYQVKIHHFSVNEYLSMKSETSAPEKEKNKHVLQKHKKTKDSKNDESSKNEKEIKKIEASIQDKEIKLKQIEIELVNLRYDDESYSATLKAYEETKKELDDLLTNWEKLLN